MLYVCVSYALQGRATIDSNIQGTGDFFVENKMVIRN